MKKRDRKIRIEIEEHELWELLITAISNNAPWPRCFKAILPANRVIKALREISI